MTPEEFREKFKGGSVKRAKWWDLLLNVAVALSSSEDPAAEAVLVEALNHAEPLVREHTEWALERIRRRKEFPNYL